MRRLRAAGAGRATGPVGVERRTGPAEPAPSPDAAGELLRLDGVRVDLGGRTVLRDVSFSVRPGEIVGMIGPNGAGKTTTLRVILGLQPVTRGRVLLTGRSRTSGEVSVGYVPQKLTIDPDVPLRARDVVSLGIDGHRLGFPLPSRRRRAAIMDALRAVGADGYADTRISELSGGQQQRVLIAHALVSRPRLLLLDEPLANLDISSAHDVVALLTRLAREQRIAVVISAHDMNPLVPVMDRIVYLAGGRAAVGRTEDVVRSEVLSGLYGAHVDVIRVHGRILVVAGSTGGPAGSTPATPSGHDAGPAAPLPAGRVG